MIELHTDHISCEPGELDDAKRLLEKEFPSRQYDCFTVRNGKAKYHHLSLADNSCGIYYAWRNLEDGFAKKCRQLEPTDQIKVWPKTEIKKTSEQWQAELEMDVKVLDPDGWDRENYQYSFYEERITELEYRQRVAMSSVKWDPKEMKS